MLQNEVIAPALNLETVSLSLGFEYIYKARPDEVVIVFYTARLITLPHNLDLSVVAEFVGTTVPVDSRTA